MHNLTADLFPSLKGVPSGLGYWTEVITSQMEATLVSKLETLDFAPYEFRGVSAKRRVVAFGFQHDYRTRRLQEARALPCFLKDLRETVALLTHTPAETFEQVLVSEYSKGTPIGWHRDRSHYGTVVGVSLLSSATLRFRRPVGDAWDRYSQTLAPRSAYLLAGEVRSAWEHSIPEVSALRYSVTFRTMVKGAVTEIG